MHIQQETSDKYAIEAYTDCQVTINGTNWSQNIVVSRHGIVTDWNIQGISDLNETSVRILLKDKPEIIIIGHFNSGQFAPPATLAMLSQSRIGLECMSVGAACRTYNVLLSENREVVLGLVLSPAQPTGLPCQKK